jgi:uncharacterized protein
MYIILSPTKTMMQPKLEFKAIKASKPHFLSKAESINTFLKKLNKKELQKLMKLSDKLTEETFNKINEWGSSENYKYPAVLSYYGTAFKYLKAQEWSDDTANYAQNNLLILSGLYGILKPYDLVEKYRLEMGLKFKFLDGYTNLYDFWFKDIINYLTDFKTDKIIVNLASNEYIKVINKYSYFDKIINCTFLQNSNGKLKVVANHSKAARGSMANFVLQNKIKAPNKLKEFNDLGYLFNIDRSDNKNLVFVRNN